MIEIKNKGNKRVCDISKDRTRAVIKKGHDETVIRAEGNAKLIIENR